MQKIKFNKNNKIRFGQDHAFYIGIPTGIEFTVKRLRKKDPLYELTGCGYGCTKHDSCYGNGRLYVRGSNIGHSVHKRVKKVFTDEPYIF